ncbi:MAG TPA: FKBP-type peptidyl-prolyl cis-trans isomerase [Acidimicrobiales bacterium]|nr:FKBP-type peptidyl-prolyl cis-trans isomerase [Acidimicrobiales bacterium]
MFPRTPHRRAMAAIALAGAGALGLAACSSSPTSSSGVAKVSYNTGSGPDATTTTAPDASPLTAIAPIPAADLSPAGTAGQAPTVTVPAGTPPTGLESADLITGTGREAAPGDHVTVQYVLATYSAGKVIQSSWTSQPFSFTLGQGQVIPGWDKGVVGMHVGGRRELIIPPSLGYGATPPQGAQGIGANDTLVFVVDLLSIA